MFPAIAVVPMVVEVVVHVKFLSGPAFAVGTDVLTFTITTSVAVQPSALVAVIV